MEEVYRSPNSKHWQKVEDPTEFVAEFSTGPIHYQKVAGGALYDKNPSFRQGTDADEWISDESDVTVRTYRTGAGAELKWWTQVTETLSGKGLRVELGARPTPATGRARMRVPTEDGRGWHYIHTRSGAKLEGPYVDAPKGGTSHVFHYELIGGADPLQAREGGGFASGEDFWLPKPYLFGADGVRYEVGEWKLGANSTLIYAYDDAGLPPSAYPYYVDPTTTFSTAAADDQYLEGFNGSTYPPTGFSRLTGSTSLWTGKYVTGSGYWIDVALLKWNTSSLPDDATVQSTNLSVAVIAATTFDARQFQAEYYQWDGSSASDYTTGGTNTAHAGTAIGSISAGVRTFALQNLTNISKTGTTYLRATASGTATPTNDNYVQFAAFEDNARQDPQLVVTYTLLTDLIGQVHI